MTPRTVALHADGPVTWRDLGPGELREAWRAMRVWLWACGRLAVARGVEAVDPRGIVGGGAALLPRGLQEAMWGEARFPKPLRWRGLVEAAARGIKLPPVRVLRIAGHGGAEDSPRGALAITLDGNHRTLLARRLGWPRLDAEILELRGDAVPPPPPLVRMLREERAARCAGNRATARRPS